ncbi:MAG TPA: TetR/AcrR family transcriptional regulator [Solirubrobacteraceae bacterium]|jgi:TetR/AcrR family transcriptional regulator, regulator of autoinduction and epiphytic fitness|nr:TetR/AcrR family transcriptional regulator [Solirubrobacteraceae bacterium]
MATPATTDPRVERSRTAVLDAAAGLLLEGGVPALTVEAVVERSGVARSTIYRHWATRRDLLVAAFERLMPPVADPDVEGPLGERLQTLLEAQVRNLRRATWAAAIPTMLEATSRDPELAGVRERLREQHRGPVRRTLERAIERGELPADTDIDEAVSQLAGPIMFRQLISGEPIDAEFGRRVVQLFLASRRRAG